MSCELKSHLCNDVNKQLAASLGPRFYLNIYKCKHISETGAQQVIDVFLFVFLQLTALRPDYILMHEAGWMCKPLYDLYLLIADALGHSGCKDNPS